MTGRRALENPHRRTREAARPLRWGSMYEAGSSVVTIHAAAYAGVAGALGYAGLKLHWAFGGTLGVSDPAPWDDTSPGSPWEAVSGNGMLRFLAFEGTAVLAGLAALVLLALVEPWGRALPRRPLRALAWLGFALMGCAVLAGAGGMIGEALGFLAVAPDRYTAVSWYVFACFLALAAGFAGTAWRSRAS